MLCTGLIGSDWGRALVSVMEEAKKVEQTPRATYCVPGTVGFLQIQRQR